MIYFHFQIFLCFCHRSFPFITFHSFVRLLAFHAVPYAAYGTVEKPIKLYFVILEDVFAVFAQTFSV